MSKVALSLALLAVALCFVTTPTHAGDCGLAGHVCSNDTDCCAPMGCVLVQGGMRGCGDAKLSISFHNFAPPSPICPVVSASKIKPAEEPKEEEGEDVKSHPFFPPGPAPAQLEWCTYNNNDCYESSRECPEQATAYLGECVMVGDYPAIVRCDPVEGTATFHYYNATDCSCQWSVTHTKSWAINQCLTLPSGMSTQFACINMESYSGSAGSSSSEVPPDRKKKVEGKSSVQLK